MSRPSAPPPTTSATARSFPDVQPKAQIEMGEIEREINDNKDRTLSSILKGVIERVRSLTEADGAIIAVRDSWGVVCRASAGEAPAVGSRLQAEPSLTRKCLESGQVVVCEDTEQRSKPAATTLRLHSVVVVPVHGRGSVLGVVEVLSARAAAFRPEHIADLQRVAQLLASVLQREEPTQSEKRAGKTRRAWTAAGAVFLLVLILLWLEIYHPRRKVPSATANPAVPGTGNPAELPARTATRESEKVHGPKASEHSETEAAAPTASSSSSALPRLGGGAAAAAPVPKLPRAQSNTTEVVPRPALIIEGAPPGAQIFVDDQLAGATGSNGEAELSALAPGQHRLRVMENGYQDYERGVDLPAGQTSRIVAQLEPFQPPLVTEPTKAPSFEFKATIPRIATPSVPDFTLYRTLKGHSGWVTGVAFSADGKRLASGSSDQTIKFWDVPTGQEMTTVASKIKEVQALAFSRDGHWLAAENSVDTVTLWDAATGGEVRRFPSNKPLGVLGSSWVYSIAFSPDGRWLASGVDDRTVRLWDVETGRSIRDLTAGHRSVIYAAFSPDGGWLASGGDEKTIKIWEVATGEEIRTLRGHKKDIYAVAFSSNGRYLASASADKSVKLWDVATGREIRTLTGHGSDVTSIAFSPDSRWLASGSWDKTIKIWEVQTGQEVRTLTGYNHHIYAVAFDSHGRWLASGSEDGTIKLWRVGQR
jgi:WD40 repeat protein